MATDIVAQFGFEFTSNLDALKKQWDAAKKGNDELVASLKKLDKELDKTIKIKREDVAVERNRKIGRDHIIKDEEKINKTRTKGNDILRRRVTQLAGLAASYVSAKAIVAGFADSFTGALDVSLQSDIINMSAAEIQNWGRVVERVTGDAGAAFATFKAISKDVGDLETKGASAQAQMSARYGVSVMDGGKAKSPDKIFQEVNDEINKRGLSKSAALSIYAERGWPEEMLRIGKMGSAKTNAMLSNVRGSQHQLTKSDAETLKRMNSEIATLTQSLESLFTGTLLSAAEKIFEIIDGANNLLINMRGGEGSVSTMPDVGFFSKFARDVSSMNPAVMAADYLFQKSVGGGNGMSWYDNLKAADRANRAALEAQRASHRSGGGSTVNENHTSLGGQTFNINGGDGLNIAQQINNGMADALNTTLTDRIS